ncbi:uncharacterized protein LOC131289516 [Anopheles ziemanni]|uniref:uncharacterized protein LOC131260437 n=1 Tax=Anopheles coustani TaxID=139045 RepID=UPI00265A5C75|nr:uncharacterized protein LOC131260437 [Anopheles coustani]XP_058174775.1 uncharacterized protein LOC131289516 [Anopheles ziemanni]
MTTLQATQLTLKQSWEKVFDKLQTAFTEHNCMINTKRSFQIFWIWFLYMFIAYVIVLSIMVVTSQVRFVNETNHYILYAMRIYAYLSETAISLSFALFTMILRILVVELQKKFPLQSMSETKLRSIVQLHRHICQMIENFCAVYGWALLLIFFEHFLILTDRLYFSFRMYRSNTVSLKTIIGMLATWVLPFAVNDMLLIGVCVATDVALESFENHLCAVGNINSSDEETKYMLSCFCLYVSEHRPKFRVLNAFNLNFNLIYASCATIVTYLIVFLQFDTLPAV